MKKVISKFRVAFAALSVALVGVMSASASANSKADFPTLNDGKRVLQCSIAIGEFQEVSVYSMSDGTFRITTLNKAGAAHAYQMPSKQWSVGKVEVPCSHDEKKICGEIYANDHFWSYDFGTSIGDCS